MSTDTIDHTERIQRLAGDIADRYPDSETHAATQAIIAHLGALASALAASEQRAETQLKRAERLAQAIMGLCEGDANDIEFKLDLYPLDLYDQTGGGFVVPTSQDAAVGRTARLRKALHTVAAMADERGKRLSPYSPDTLSEDAQSEMGLHPGDVDKGGAA